MKTNGIPMWITLALGLTVILGTATGIMALAGSGLEDYMGEAWGGRNLGIALVSLAAIVLKSPSAYLAALIGSIAREIGDIVQLSQGDPIEWPIVIFAAVLLVIWLYGVVVANKAREALGEARISTPIATNP